MKENTKGRKGIALFLSVIMVLSAFVMPLKSAKAASPEWGYSISTGYWAFTSDNEMTIKILNGEHGFCIEPGASVTTIEGYKETAPKYSDALWNKLVSIAHVGYNKDKNSHADFAATQLFMWLTIREAEGVNVDWNPPNNVPNWKSRCEDIREGLEDMKDYEVKASFNNKDYEITVGETLTITDTKGVLSKFGYKVVHKPKGVTATIDGNKLKITATSSADDGYIQVAIPNKNMVSDNRYFYHPSSQDVSNIGFKDPNFAKINLKVNKFGELVVNKYNDDRSALVPNTTFKITGPDGYSKTHTTNASGKIKIDELLPGTYKAVETKAAPGYLLDDTVHTFKIEPSEKTTLNIENDEPKGTITVTKEDTYGNKLKGGQFQIIAASDIKNKAGKTTYYTKGEVVETITTDEDGIAESKKLPLGKYQVKELHAPDGYLLNSEVKNVSLTYKDQNTSVVYDSAKVSDKEPTGTITLKKAFLDTGLTGDSVLSGAVYEIRAKEDITNKAGNKVFYHKGDLVAERTIKSDGTTDPVTNLPLGTYTVKETKASEGCLLDEKTYEVALTYKDEVTSVITKAVTSKEKVKRLGVHIFKAGIKEVNGSIPGLEGAEFTIKLKSDVDKALKEGFTYEEIWSGINKNGDKVEVDAGRVSQAQKIAPNYGKVTTDENGDGYLEDVPYGKYIGKETVTPKDYYTAEDFIFTLDKDKTEVDIAHKYKNIYLNNEQMESQVKLVKKDKESGKLVSLNSATFKITAEENIIDRATGKVIFSKGEVIKQKVAGKWYDEFTTNSKGMVGTFTGPFGTVLVPLTLPVGEYSVSEIKTPTGFLVPENEKIPFTIENIRDFDKDEDGDYITTVEVYNSQPKGKLTLTKKIDKNPDADLSLVDRDFTKIKFALYAKEDIIDMADGEVIYKANEKINEYNLDAHGKLYLDNLWIGKYYLKETQTLDGLILDETKYDVTFTKEDNTTKVIEVAKEVTNYATQTSITKETNKESLVSDAEFRLSDSKGKVVKEWKTTDKPYVIEGLKVGENYKLEELTAPEGFVLAKPISFTVENTKELQKYKMIDKQVEFIKTDVDGNAITGMEYTVTNSKTKDIVDKGITNAKSRNFLNNLKIGESYTITETKTPKGFVTAKPIEFTVTEDNNLQTVTMKDKQVIVEKTTNKGEPVTGAELKVVDKDNNIVDSWTVKEDKSHKVKGLIEGHEYTLIEDYAPEGFVLAKPISFQVTEKKENQTISMVDKQVEFIKTDVDGNAITGMEYTVTNSKTKDIVDKGITNAKSRNFLNNLKIGESYTITETKTPNGFVTADPIKFTVTESNDLQTVTMIDKFVEVEKVSPDNELVIGAEMKVTDKEGNKVDSWTVTKEEGNHKINNLKEGETYTLWEEYAPDTFVKSMPMTFTVTGANDSGDKENQTVTMIDKKISIVKTDVDGNIVPGAEFTITNLKTKQVVDVVSTGEKPEYISNLIEGHSYEITETKTPKGYVTALPEILEVTKGKSIQDMKIANKIVEVKKTDIGGENVVGAELKVLDKDGNIVDSWTVKEDEKEHIVKGLKEGENYTLVEDYAPNGKVIASKVDFTVTDEKVNQKVEMIDKTVTVDKQNVKGDLLSGAKLQVVSKKTKQIVDSWTTDGKPHEVSGLIEGGEYTLVELKAPKGYAKAKPIDFIVTTDKDTQEIVMTDKQVKFIKENTSHKKLEGGEFELKDKDGKVLSKFEAKKDGVILTGLTEGESYVITEKEAPKGHKLAKDVKFTVTDTKEMQEVVMIDKIVPKVVKTGDNNNLFALGIVMLIAAGITGILAVTGRKK